MLVTVAKAGNGWITAEADPEELRVVRMRRHERLDEALADAAACLARSGALGIPATEREPEEASVHANCRQFAKPPEDSSVCGGKS